MPWSQRAAELAKWVWERLVNRTDVWGGYHAISDRKKLITRNGKKEELGATTTRPAKAHRGRVTLTPNIIKTHFQARSECDVIGLHTTAPDNTSKWGCPEIDWHGPDSTAPEINERAALGWYDKARQLGHCPLLTDSNGKGGFHLHLLFASAVPTPNLFHYLRRLVSDHAARGLPNRPETFPKQPRIQPARFGNWVRVVGRHHTRPHWSRVWDGTRWIEGNEAIDFILALKGDPPSLVPADEEERVRVEAYLAKLPQLSEGQGRDDVAYNLLAFLVRDLKQPDERALSWAKQWDAGNHPPKGRERLEAILLNVHQYGQRDYGSGINRNGSPSTTSEGSAHTAYSADGVSPPETGGEHQSAEDSASPPWPDPILFGGCPTPPRFPVDVLPSWLARWVRETATATQTPPDLAAMLALSICGAALARKVRVEIRKGWQEPLNLFTVSVLPPGERKSEVFTRAKKPVVEVEKAMQRTAGPCVAEAETMRQILEGRLKTTVSQAAKGNAEAEKEAKEIAKQLAANPVPVIPRLWTDDVTPEKLSALLDRHGGRMLLASPEGTIFEIAKGRYSETANFDIFLRGHAGDDLRVSRISREGESIERPALSVALTVQPDVVDGLASNASMRGRGFLARFLYALPASLVGKRDISPDPVSEEAEQSYLDTVEALWRINCPDEEIVITFNAFADLAMKDFQGELEPQLGVEGDLSLLAGWGNKLCGAVARIAAIFHVCDLLAAGKEWQGVEITAATLKRAIQLGRDYLTPHAQLAFACMGADERTAKAAKVWESTCRRLQNAYSAHSADAPLTVTRRDLFNWNRRSFKSVEDLDPIIDMLENRYLLRSPTPLPGQGIGRGHKSPVYEVHPMALESSPCAHSTHCAHSDDEDGRDVTDAE